MGFLPPHPHPPSPLLDSQESEKDPARPSIPFALALLKRPETRPRRAARGGPWCAKHVKLIGAPPVVETVRIEPSGVRVLRGGVMFTQHSIHEGMDWGAVGYQKNDPREPAEMTVTKLKCPTKKNAEIGSQETTSKARKIVSDQNMRRQSLDRVGSFRDGLPARSTEMMSFDCFPKRVCLCLVNAPNQLVRRNWRSIRF